MHRNTNTATSKQSLAVQQRHATARVSALLSLRWAHPPHLSGRKDKPAPSGGSPSGSPSLPCPESEATSVHYTILHMTRALTHLEQQSKPPSPWEKPVNTLPSDLLFHCWESVLRNNPIYENVPLYNLSSKHTRFRRYPQCLLA